MPITLPGLTAEDAKRIARHFGMTDLHNDDMSPLSTPASAKRASTLQLAGCQELAHMDYEELATLDAPLRRKLLDAGLVFAITPYADRLDLDFGPYCVGEAQYASPETHEKAQLAYKIPSAALASPKLVEDLQAISSDLGLFVDLGALEALAVAKPSRVASR